MLISFRIKNFLSIKDELTFSMLAEKKTNHPGSIATSGKEKIYTTGLITGANASGKSALIDGMISALLFLRHSSYMGPGAQIPRIMPFKFDEITIKSSSFFEFTFTVKDVKYIYGFSADVFRVYSEYLYKYTSAKKSLIFERTNTNEYNFPQHLRPTLNDLVPKNAENKLFLATASTWNFFEAIVPFKWLLENVEIVQSFAPNPNYIIPNDKETKDFVLGILKAADLNIVDYTVERQTIKYNDAQSKNVQALNENVGMPLFNESETFVNIITTYHKIKDDKGNEKILPLDLREESAGTQKMFYMALSLRSILAGKTIIIDEIEKELHSHLVELIIKIFNNEVTNPHRSQLIFTTHSRNLIDDDIFDHSQINLVEKNEIKGTTTLYKLSDFSIRNNLNIEKGYNNGRFGAVPFIKYPGLF